MEHLKIFARGELLVTSTGEAIVDEVLPRSVLDSPDIFINVEFDPNEPCPPCAGDTTDDTLDWELFIRTVHERFHLKKEEELRLKIVWNVNTARTILWRIYVAE